MAITNSPVTGTMKYLTIGENTYELAGSSGSGNGTVTSIGVSNATNGGLSISGSPITTSGSITIGHSNVLTNAQTTSGVYPIKIDKNGHISEYGSAVSIPTKVSDLTNDSGFVTTDTKNTAGSTNINSKIFLIGATTQDNNPQTYSNSKLYFSTGLYSKAENSDDESTIAQAASAIKFEVLDDSYDNIYLTMRHGAITLSGTDPSSAGFDPTEDFYIQYDAENDNVTIKGVVTPTDDRDAANKAYVDSLPGLSSWAKASTKPSYTASQVGASASDHVHGNITNAGDITATAPTIANGDQIIINDNSASKITNGPTFDGSTTTKALTPKGTWETFSQTDENVKVTAISSGTNYYPTLIDTINNSTGTLKSNSLFKYSIDSSASYIDLGDTSLKGKIRLSNTTSGNTVRYTKIQPSGTADRTITLPDATGTVALTSNIPTVPTNISSFTNDSGYTTNTGTVTSVGLSNATNGGLTISGSPVTGSGSITVGHSNVLTSAQTTQALYPIKIDKNGHISAYGTAVTSLPASDVSSWAKASSKPSYTASEVSAVALSDKYTRSSFGDLGWSNQSEGDSKVIAKSALAFWDGSYLETVTGESSDVYSSNLWRCKTGGIVGSYQAFATTVADLLTQLRYKNGSMGSVNIGTAYTLNGTTIPTGWYNFMYSPHRWGGNQNASSAAYRDNTDYGMLLLASMTNENGIFWIRFSSGAIANAKSLLTNDIVMYNRGTSSDTITLTAGTVTQIVLNNQLINTNTNLYSISDGGIKVGCAGYYRVTAGAYFGTATATYQADVFVHKRAGSYSNDVSYEIGSGRDCIATTYGGNPEPQFTKIVSASKNQVFYLSVRATGGSGTNVYPGNKMTFLQIQCLGS